MSTSNQEETRKRVEELRQELAQIEQQLSTQQEPRWQPTGYYTAYFATTGFMLGGIGALVSLVFNIVGSLVIGQHPLQIIKVYLTFPMGARALAPELDSGLVLAVGCCLYIATGMLLGVIVNLLLTMLTADSSVGKRFLVATIIGVLIWLINFYGILSWLQPLLFGGDWIVSEIPFWVALATHLVFVWTMAALYPLGLYHHFPKNPDIDTSPAE